MTPLADRHRVEMASTGEWRDKFFIPDADTLSALILLLLIYLNSNYMYM